VRTFFLLFAFLPAVAADLPVEPGSDAAAALRQARDAARQLPPETPRRIVLRGGDYFVGETLVLDARDSGLTIEAAPGRTPTVYGGFRVAGWRPDGDRFWSADARGRDFRLLIVNGRFCPTARFPATGYLTHLSEFKVRWMSTTGGGWERKPTPEELSTMRYKAGDLPESFEPRNAEIRVYHMWDESLLRAASIDPAAWIIRFATPAGHPPGGFGVHKYAVFNIREGMLAPGQWYLDRAAGKVVYWPLAGEDMAKAEAIAPAVESIVKVQGTREAPARRIAVRGVRFSVTNTPAIAGGFGAGRFDGAVSVNWCEECALERIEVFNVAGQGIKGQNTKGLRVSRSRAHDTGAAGIVIRGDGFEVADSRVYRVGLHHPSAIGISIGGTKGALRHNEIFDTRYSAIQTGGSDHVIEANRIHRAMQELHDGAAIYVSFGKRNVVRGNYAYDIPDTGGYGSSAYYLDEQCDDCVVERNLSVGVARPSHNHMAHNGVIRDNVFIVDGDARMTFQKSVGFRLEKNVVQAKGSLTLDYADDGIAGMSGNVLFSGTGKVGRRSGKLPAEGFVTADPRLVKKGDGWYRFARRSPARKLGIGEIDVRGAGPRKVKR
jgi:hypothetical protein